MNKFQANTIRKTCALFDAPAFKKCKAFSLYRVFTSCYKDANPITSLNLKEFCSLLSMSACHTLCAFLSTSKINSHTGYKIPEEQKEKFKRFEIRRLNKTREFLMDNKYYGAISTEYLSNFEFTPMEFYSNREETEEPPKTEEPVEKKESPIKLNSLLCGNLVCSDYFILEYNGMKIKVDALSKASVYNKIKNMCVSLMSGEEENMYRLPFYVDKNHISILCKYASSSQSVRNQFIRWDKDRNVLWVWNDVYNVLVTVPVDYRLRQYLPDESCGLRINKEDEYLFAIKNAPAPEMDYASRLDSFHNSPIKKSYDLKQLPSIRFLLGDIKNKTKGQIRKVALRPIKDYPMSTLEFRENCIYLNEPGLIEVYAEYRKNKNPKLDKRARNIL